MQALALYLFRHVRLSEPEPLAAPGFSAGTRSYFNWDLVNHAIAYSLLSLSLLSIFMKQKQPLLMTVPVVLAGSLIGVCSNIVNIGLLQPGISYFMTRELTTLVRRWA